MPSAATLKKATPSTGRLSPVDGAPSPNGRAADQDLRRIAKAQPTTAGGEQAAELAARVRAMLSVCLDGAVNEKRMFGVLAFLLNGNMLCYVSNHGLTVRLARDDQAAALAAPEGERCVVSGRRMPGFVLVAHPEAKTTQQIQPWLSAALDYVGTLRKK